MYYVTSKYKNGKRIELWYRDFKNINEANNFKLIWKIYNSLIFNDSKNGYLHIKIRENLYSTEHGCFTKRVNDRYKNLMIGDIVANYQSRHLM